MTIIPQPAVVIKPRAYIDTVVVAGPNPLSKADLAAARRTCGWIEPELDFQPADPAIRYPYALHQPTAETWDILLEPSLRLQPLRVDVALDLPGDPAMLLKWDEELQNTITMKWRPGERVGANYNGGATYLSKDFQNRKTTYLNFVWYSSKAMKDPDRPGERLDQLCLHIEARMRGRPTLSKYGVGSLEQIANCDPAEVFFELWDTRLRFRRLVANRLVRITTGGRLRFDNYRLRAILNQIKTYQQSQHVWPSRSAQPCVDWLKAEGHRQSGVFRPHPLDRALLDQLARVRTI